MVEGLVVEALVDLDTELVVHGLRLHATGVLEGEQFDVFADVVQDLFEVEAEEAVLQVSTGEGGAVVLDEHALDGLEHVLELEEAEVLDVEHEVDTTLDELGKTCQRHALAVLLEDLHNNVFHEFDLHELLLLVNEQLL